MLDIVTDLPRRQAAAWTSSTSARQARRSSHVYGHTDTAPAFGRHRTGQARPRRARRPARVGQDRDRLRDNRRAPGIHAGPGRPQSPRRPVADPDRPASATAQRAALLAVATGPYAGEGFDCPALDTLFLAAPVAQKGRLVQYAGRILRPYDGKATAEVHDYHDELTGVLASSLAKRAPGYTSLGFPDPLIRGVRSAPGAAPGAGRAGAGGRSGSARGCARPPASRPRRPRSAAGPGRPS